MSSRGYRPPQYKAKRITIRSTQKQIETLIKYMAKHRDFANNEIPGPNAGEEMAKRWTDLRKILNKLGPEKTLDQWKVTWRDLKRKVRRMTDSELEAISTQSDQPDEFADGGSGSQNGQEKSATTDDPLNVSDDSGGGNDDDDEGSDPQRQGYKASKWSQSTRTKFQTDTLSILQDLKKLIEDNNRLCFEQNQLLIENNTMLKESLRRIRKYKPGPPAICKECGKTFKTNRTLVIHQRSHGGARPYMCNECGKTYIQPAHLQNHIRTHSGEKNFPCTDCGKSFYRKFELERHKTVHTGAKPFECEICKKLFSQNTNLVQHLKTHTNDRPHMCVVCSKTFITKSKLRLHEAKHEDRVLLKRGRKAKSFNSSKFITTEQERFFVETTYASSASETDTVLSQ